MKNKRRYIPFMIEHSKVGIFDSEKEKPIIEVWQADVEKILDAVALYLNKEKEVISQKEEIRTIPSSKEEAIALYGYNPKTKEYPWMKEERKKKTLVKGVIRAGAK